ncbi:hypothetical protein [Paenibacillus arenosi]|uniref:ABC transporter permease n=1 Tax=Paenibacillus arenosi TaxID=2774142 RepID=A0ABR9AUQ1_9BACL|nr:hypothetical protein [Paenibacillus arenosi]MBD8497844.1 hypothetical protein [Paenibacillus arenosi]
MKGLSTLIIAEGKRLQSERMQLLLMASPLLLISMTVYVLPVINQSISFYYQINLDAYYPHVFGMFVCLIPLMLGVVTGFALLDERDEQLIAYYSITPISRQGYMMVRYMLPIFVTAVYIMLIFVLQQQITLSGYSFFIIFSMLMLEMLMMGLAMSVFAMNKVEGLALSKAAGVIVVVPQLVAFFPKHLHWLGWWAPPYWIIEMLTNPDIVAGSEFPSFVVGIIGLSLHSVILLWLYRKYRLQVE